MNMKIVLIRRRSTFISRRTFFLPFATTHSYASQSPLGADLGPTRKQVTIVNDDGRVRWGDLTAKEKVARTTQKTFYSGIILTGILMTGGVTFLLYTEIFSSESKTSHFNRAVDEVRTNPRAQELLGPGNKIQAFGETTWNKWARARPIASTIREDRNGQQHFLMHFSVKGPRASGVVNVHMVKNVESSEFEYKLLTLDVHGQPRIYLRNADAPKAAKKPAFRLFGVQWR